jgi:hypothetical protein
MNPKAMEPYGAGLRAYFEGDGGAQLLLRRDDGQEVSMPVSHFFGEPEVLVQEETGDYLARLRK